jgi:uncharacterized protein (DUF1330 family)
MWQPFLPIGGPHSLNLLFRSQTTAHARRARACSWEDITQATYKFALVLAAAGFALGAGAIQALHAQAKPPAYLIASVEVSDVNGYQKDFLPPAKKSLANAGAKYVAASGAAASSKIVTLAGQPPSRLVVLQFENMDKLKSRYQAEGKAVEESGHKCATSLHSAGIEGPAQQQVGALSNRCA